MDPQSGTPDFAKSGLHGLRNWGFPEIRGTLLGVPIIRIIIYWGLHWGPLILGNYHLRAWGYAVRVRILSLSDSVMHDRGRWQFTVQDFVF